MSEISPACNELGSYPSSETRMWHVASQCARCVAARATWQRWHHSYRADPLSSALTCFCPTLPHSGCATLFPEEASGCLDARSEVIGGRGRGGGACVKGVHVCMSMTAARLYERLQGGLRRHEWEYRKHCKPAAIVPSLALLSTTCIKRTLGV